MSQCASLQRALTALSELDDSIEALTHPDHANYRLWEITRERLRMDLLWNWLWETVERGTLQEYVNLEDLWDAWKRFCGVDPEAKEAGGFPRKVWTNRVSWLPSPGGPSLGERVPRRPGGRFMRVWPGWRFRGGGP